MLLFLILLLAVAHVPLLMPAQSGSYCKILAWGLPDSQQEHQNGLSSLSMVITGLAGVDPGALSGILGSGLADANEIALPESGTVAAIAAASVVERPSNGLATSALKASQLSQVAQPDNQSAHGVLTGKIVVLDPGHGGNDTGTIGPDGIEEKWITLPITAKAAQVLRQEGATVIMTRTGDTNPSLYDRTDIANRAGAAVFVSIHGNSYIGDRTIGGTGTYTYSPFPGIPLGQHLDVRLKLADCLQNALVDALRLHNRGIYEDNLEELRNAQMPAALVEVAFLSNPVDERLLCNSNFQQKAGAAIAQGITDFLTGH
jgi:N-acetylmuramoyl-L-alanine amidase